MVPTVANLYWPICGHSSETKSNGIHYWLCGVHYWQHSYMLSSGSIWVINIKMGQNRFQTGFVLLVMFCFFCSLVKSSPCHHTLAWENEKCGG